MALPDFLAQPIFHIIYTINRRQDGAKIPPIRRRVKPAPREQSLAFDRMIDTALADGHNTLINYSLPYPKADFLNYLCDWRGFVAHGSPLHELDKLQPIRKSGDNNEFGNRQQIFCSPDAIWAMWFAILDWFDGEIEEWGSTQPITPLARIRVSPQDFPYLDKVQFRL